MILLIILLFTRCAHPVPDSTTKVPQLDTLPKGTLTNQSAQDVVQPLDILTLQRAVKPCERDALKGQFDKLFGTLNGTNKLVKLKKTEVEFSVSSLENAISHFKHNLPNPMPQTSRTGVLFHYGLDASGRFATALTIVEFKEVTKDAVYDYDETQGEFYMVERNSGTGIYELVQTSTTNWVPYQTDYFDKVYVDRDRNNQTEPEKVMDPMEDNSSYDAQWAAMDWDHELSVLIADNDRATASGTAKFVVSCSAEQNRFKPTFFPAHYLIVHRRNGTKDLLEDTPPNDPQERYLNRGANLGTPCPPRCKKYLVPEDGEPYRCEIDAVEQIFRLKRN